MKKYLLKEDGSFLINGYNSLAPFSNFLPGISGEWGVPLWVFYVNRAQGIISFGIQDKDHSILEFYPANKAYSLASSVGFRTFIKINQKVHYEPFTTSIDCDSQEQMSIESASFRISQINLKAGLKVSVDYFTLPNTSVGSLVRKVTIKNISKRKLDLEILDGLPRIIPFGSVYPFLKDISRTLEAWMYSFIQKDLALFRLLVDPRDVSQTKHIEGANFNYSFYDFGGKKVFPQRIVDPVVIFNQDTSFSQPVNFLRKDFKPPFSQVTSGRTPCAFSYLNLELSPGEEQAFYNLFGSAFNADSVKQFVKIIDSDFLTQKQSENRKIVESIKKHALCVSGSKKLNHYIQSTYLDNVLRGGYPYFPQTEENSNQLGARVTDKNQKPYYIFSRKHGDLERDYNHFQLMASYFSEGEANYRDINQNRRMDLFFQPKIESSNIAYFINLLKIDGYNPLVAKGEKLNFDKPQAVKVLKSFKIKSVKVAHLMVKGFYLGEFFNLLDEENIEIANRQQLVKRLLLEARRTPQAVFGEGCWIDHWRYNLDLIENFLTVYPDRLKDLFLNQPFVFWDDEYAVKERSRRYHLRLHKIYQGESLEAIKEKKLILKERKLYKNFLRTKDNRIYSTTLISKLLIVILNKAATLDPDGIGIEMEADKPGWCDSLNGLPALLGSSLCETLELKRAAKMLLGALNKLSLETDEHLSIIKEGFLFFKQLDKLLSDYLKSNSSAKDFLWWDKANTLKEDFRRKTQFFVEGVEEGISFLCLTNFLNNLIKKLNIGILKAKDKKSKLYFTYFTYAVKKYRPVNKHFVPCLFERKALPLFLEGVVHALRVEGKKELISAVKSSVLFDKKLKMYRLNSSLADQSLEIGRSRVFVPGWLENESIWLHMEYKYLLELLKHGFYEEFFTDFHNCAVCFFDPETYSRSTLENSSFIVSSAHPDKHLWGKGFVARLSGATVELLNIWIVLCLGKNPFFLDNQGKLCLKFAPILKKELFTDNSQNVEFNGQTITLAKNTFSFKLFSKTLVVYHNPQRKDTFSKKCTVKQIVIDAQGQKQTVNSEIIRFPLSLAVRNQQVERIDVYLD